MPVYTNTSSIAAHLESITGAPLMVRAIGWPNLEHVPAGAWSWSTTNRQLAAPGQFRLSLNEIMETRDPADYEPANVNLFGEALEPATAPVKHVQLGLLEVAPTSTFDTPAPAPITGDAPLF